MCHDVRTVDYQIGSYECIESNPLQGIAILILEGYQPIGASHLVDIILEKEMMSCHAVVASSCTIATLE